MTTPADIITEQHLNRIRVRLSIDYLNSAGRKGEDATGDDWKPNAHILQQVRVWTDDDLAALDAAGYQIVPKPERQSVCPTCGSDDPETVEDDCDMPGHPPVDPWHGGAE